MDKPGKYFKDLDPTCIALDASFVSKSTLEQLDAAVDEALKNEGWCEVGLASHLTRVPHFSSAAELEHLRCI